LSNGAFQEVDSASSDLGMLLNGRVGNQICLLNYSLSLSLSLSLIVCFNGHFQGELGLAGVY